MAKSISPEASWAVTDRLVLAGVELVSRPIATVENGYVRHQSENLARELIQLHAERSVRIAGEGKDGYRIERKA